ncbi:UDP-N-acetylmuramoyl-L-alanyl-D-glutamate--2,6-diaminopimelate ligase [Facilibium subflavum]|uniref:UDP-N-acetylmuramoyl-L-alanyl-D-glutamate--2, 6-diaminopimelate ligase n=1 Tax=Facilibium subflavum TaxID=2219058 RepID=UPI000E64DF26|nr:UDP-N-acetylmuramoyl-L-alanyl-D-glutamate--2,6-diaminopimelate ligase [Facilibium subflavum]
MKQLSQVIAFLNITLPVDADVIVNRIYQDQRLCGENDIFIALSGAVFDGHQYVRHAQAKGACLCIVEDIKRIDNTCDLSSVVEITDIRQRLSALADWFYQNPSQKLNITAVTGTNGKTTVSHYIAQLFCLLGEKTAILGTTGNGIYPKLETSSHTTLDNLQLQSHLSDYQNEAVKNVVMEASSHAIAQNRIAQLAIDTAVFTNLDEEHLDYHQTLENYFEAKAKLFEQPHLKNAVINIDDPYGQRLYDKLKKQGKLSLFCYSTIHKNADTFFYIKQYYPDAIAVDIFWQKHQVASLHLPVLGDFNISNIAAAFTSMMANDYPLMAVVEKLPELKGVPGRLELLKMANKALVVIDFAHTPDALQKVLKAMQNQLNGRLICVFGCGGDRQKTKRASMAAIAQKLADFCIVSEDNNRYESFESISADIIKGFDPQIKNYYIEPKREIAIEKAISMSEACDIILLAGKGHENYIDEKGQKRYFNEKEVVESIWRKS